MDPDKQWRIETGRHLIGAALRKRRWVGRGEEWDHEHCDCCWAKFAEWEGPDIQHEGYVTVSDADSKTAGHWVCEQCLQDLQVEMDWRLLPSTKSE